MELRLDIDMREVERRLTGGLVKQAPYAMSLALNRLAARGRDLTKSRLDNDFTIRSGWVAKGIRAQNSTKRDLVAVVGSVDDFMADQAVGAPAEGAVPMVGRGKPRPTTKSKTPPSRWPGSSRWGDKFVGRPGKADSTLPDALWQRVIKRGRGPVRNRKGLRLLYSFVSKDSPRQNKRMRKWPLPDYVEQVIRQNVGKDIEAALEEAIRTAK